MRVEIVASLLSVCSLNAAPQDGNPWTEATPFAQDAALTNDNNQERPLEQPPADAVMAQTQPAQDTKALKMGEEQGKPVGEQVVEEENDSDESKKKGKKGGSPFEGLFGLGDSSSEEDRDKPSTSNTEKPESDAKEESKKKDKEYDELVKSLLLEDKHKKSSGSGKEAEQKKLMELLNKQQHKNASKEESALLEELLTSAKSKMGKEKDKEGNDLSEDKKDEDEDEKDKMDEKDEKDEEKKLKELSDKKEKADVKDEEEEEEEKDAEDAEEEALPHSYRLKGIRSLLTPQLLYNLAKAGSGDTLVIAANGFPSDHIVEEKKEKVAHLDGLSIPTILKEIMKLIKVSSEAEFPLLLMKPEEKESEEPAIWAKYKKIIETADGEQYQWAKLSRAKFLEQAQKAVAIIQSGDDTAGSSLIVTKGKIEDKETHDKLMHHTKKLQD